MKRIKARRRATYKQVDFGKGPEPVSLQWFRGAGRWNNGATRFGRKYEFHWIIGTAANNKAAASVKK